MKNKKFEGFGIIVCGLICIAMGLFVLVKAHTIYPNSVEPLMQDLNWLLRNFGKTGTSIIFTIPGFIAIYSGVKMMKGK